MSGRPGKHHETMRRLARILDTGAALSEDDREELRKFIWKHLQMETGTYIKTIKVEARLNRAQDELWFQLDNDSIESMIARLRELVAMEDFCFATISVDHNVCSEEWETVDTSPAADKWDFRHPSEDE